jgi:hypothetical protein
METEKSYSIIIVDEKGSNDKVDVYSDYSISQLKTIISAKKSIGSELLNLIYKGEILNNNKKLFELGIQKNCSLFLTFGIK